MIEVKTFTVGLLEANCYLVYSAKNKVGFLIDPGAFDKRIVKAIDENNIRVKNVINTHGHTDHTAGNKKFGYPILIHENDADFLRDPVKNLKPLKDGDVIKEADIIFRVIHTPGHTPGSISLKMGDRIFTGDTLFREGVGRTDLPYGSEEDLLNSIEKRLMVFPDETQILPGHGLGSTIGHERQNNPFLRGET